MQESLDAIRRRVRAERASRPKLAKGTIFICSGSSPASRAAAEQVKRASSKR